MRVIQEEGSPSGPILRAVNAIADSLLSEFPQVTVSTLAYQYSRKPPLLTKPRANVIVQLCSIECDFGVPLNDPNSTVNAAFREDIIGWSNVMQRMYIWDYVVNFANFVMPWPNYYVIASNIRFYIQYGAKGIFEEGSYKSPGGDVQELKSYLMARLLWDPSLDDRVLIKEFTAAYYGPVGAPVIQQYLDAVSSSMSGLGGLGLYSIYTPYTAPYLTESLILSLVSTFGAANRTMVPGSVFQSRLRVAELPVLYVTMLRWSTMQAYATSHNVPWILGSLQGCFDDFSYVYVGAGMNDSGLSEGGNGLPWLKSTLGL
jgi:hypothetical protein